MREMKDSGVQWIGEIPTEWRTSEIKYYCKDVYAGGTPKSDNADFWNGDIPWIPSGSCHDCKIYEAPKTITEEGFNNSSTKKIPANTALVAMTGATCGNTGYLTFESCANQSVTAYVAKENTYSLFLWYLLQASKEHLLTYQTGGAQGGVNVDNCKNIVVPYVSYAEQQRIADYLDSKCSQIDSIIEKQQAIIEKLKEYKLSVITEAVTKGLNPDTEMKDSGYEYIGSIPSDWEVCRLRNIGNPQNGLSKGGEFFGEGYPFVSYGDIYRNYSLPENVSGLVRSSGEERENYSVQEGDIFFTRTSETIEEVGFSCVCEKTIPDATFAGFAIRVRPFNDKLLTRFAKFYFRSEHHRTYFAKEMNLVTRASLSQDLLKSMPVLILSKKEQAEIAEFLDYKCNAIAKSIDAKQKLIENLRSYKKSLIYEVVTGKKEV